MKTKILTIIAALILAFSLAGCEFISNAATIFNKKTNNKTESKSANIYGNLEDGLVENPVEAKTFVASRKEVRENAYSAYDSEGTKIGDYKTIATAINACIDKDNKDDKYGSYVTAIGKTQKLFYNKAGYASDNDDQFWFYENGNALDSYFCWDGATHMSTLRNTKFIVHETTNFGISSAQSWNSYGLLDSFGEENDSISAQTWELSSTMDAAVMEFTSRRTGITKVEYNIDLSNVTITPPYDGGSKTYAFIGYYAWQDYYVLAVGIACDTQTGNWYQFVGTSRDNSFSDVVYDTGACVLTSTWNEKGGYFVPDAESVSTSIETVLNFDEEEEEYYQTDVVKFSFSNGTTYTRVLTDALVNSFFAGMPLSMENSFIFIAGLDIKNELSTGVYTKNADYFNGSSFKNLAITSARGYVPSEEELSEVDYGYSIDNTWRGEWHDLLLNNSDDTEGFLDYVLLNTNLCCEYSGVNKKDVYSFSYDGEAIAKSQISTKLNIYQSKINSLSNATIDNVLQYNDTISEISTWLVDGQTIILDKYKNVLDFAPYYSALEVLNNIKLSDDGQQVLNQIKGMTIENAKEFKEIYDNQYQQLSTDDKTAVRITFGAGLFDSILNYAEFLGKLESETTKASVYTSYVFLFATDSGYTTKSNKTELTAQEAFTELVTNVGLIKEGTKWSGKYASYNDDPNSTKVTEMNGDNNFYPSLRIIMLTEYFRSVNIELPTSVMDDLAGIEYESFYSEFYYPLYNVTKIALRIENGDITAISDFTEAELEFLNEYWVEDYAIGNQISWNWLNGEKFMTYFNGRSAAITYMAGAPGTKPFKDYVEILNNFLVNLGYTINSYGWGVTQSEIK